MLKCLYYKEVFTEIPGEISLGISLSGCKIHCKGCHSKELWKDEGIPFTMESALKMLEEHEGVTCFLVFGGEHDIDTLMEIFKNMSTKIKTAWYCGLKKIPDDKKDIINYLNFVKIGPYDFSKGDLTKSTTNQRLYEIRHYKNGNRKINITNKLKKTKS